ncbi:MBL fold metallo-hydrolase [Reinekea marinisedimentorum]|uniref:Phosphoribosyl 1,2-cyclic phosphodiesterase n=1 Tax=Reinekea marinisedimentorum TaxID=230495 RepID=A0A4R3I4S9_9GAMM|nr:MBL fold metallo-hydrolase [Reinekea marinisedimentorum]TCS40797.1 phosphoribosyl 1,2-cyclic phosphodiesterase [Reinekea marinisedimentorum]
MKVASLGSGSKGNATIIEAADTRILIDCGFGLKDIEQRLKSKGIAPESLSAILVTHEHGDHLKGAPMLANRYRIPLWLTHGTARSIKRPVATLNLFHTGQRLSIGALDIQAVTVPHDCAEPSQFVVRHGGFSVGLLTDIGSITNHVIKEFHQCDVLLLEFNYDPEMLQNGPYPPSLKRRVSGNFGHLSNHQAVAMLQTVNRARLRHLLISHISEQNNDEQLVREILAPELTNFDLNVVFLSQQDGCDWIRLQYVD